MINRSEAHVFAPGFRLSVLDVAVLVIGFVAALAFAMVVWWWGFVVAFVVAHFFLFCNVVRMTRAFELAWAGVFVSFAGATATADVPGWPVTITVSLIATVSLVVVEMRKPSYHGLGWQWLNPKLPAWWEAWKAKHGCKNQD